MRPKSIPTPGETRRGNRNRQTSVDCHEKARLNLVQAVDMPPGNQRSLLECSAAAWSMSIRPSMAPTPEAAHH